MISSGEGLRTCAGLVRTGCWLCPTRRAAAGDSVADGCETASATRHRRHVASRLASFCARCNAPGETAGCTWGVYWRFFFFCLSSYMKDFELIILGLQQFEISSVLLTDARVILGIMIELPSGGGTII